SRPQLLPTLPLRFQMFCLLLHQIPLVHLIVRTHLFLYRCLYLQIPSLILPFFLFLFLWFFFSIFFWCFLLCFFSFLFFRCIVVFFFRFLLCCFLSLVFFFLGFIF